MLKTVFDLLGIAEKLGFVDDDKPKQAPKINRILFNNQKGSGLPTNKVLADAYRKASAASTAKKSTRGAASIDNPELIIEAAYKQVFGNTHLMESERLSGAESQLRGGKITVREFIRVLAKSDRYQALFWDNYPNVTVVELNFKHFLGRAPVSYQEISEHIQIVAENGFEAEIDSYLDSDEYFQTFGNDQVPYSRGYDTMPGGSTVGFTHVFPIFGTACSSESSLFSNGGPKLQENLAKGTASTVPSIIILPEPTSTLASTPTASKPRKSKKTRRVVKDVSVASSGSTKVAPPLARRPESIQVIDGRVQVWTDPIDKAKLLSEKYQDSLAGNPVVEFVKESVSVENADLVIEAAYRQVFGNAHLMESERLREAESQMRSGQITVMDFIRKLAQSDLYRAWFWEKYPNVTAIELNFKHLLGRAPQSYEEISEHIQIVAEGGFEAEIDSYLDSDEYFQTFGTNQVPYPRGYDTQTVGNPAGFINSFPLFGTACSSDKSKIGSAVPKLQASLIRKSPGNIPPLRPIPESYPESLTVGPEPPIPIEIRGMARELLIEVEKRRALVLFP